MSASRTLLLALVAVGAGALVWHRHRISEGALVEQTPALESRVENHALDNPPQAEEKHLTSSRTAETAPRPALATATAMAPGPTNAGSSQALLKDPETRALMRKQQEQGLAKMANQLLSKEFAQELNLTPAQVEKAKELLREKGAAGADLNTAMLFDGLDDATLAQRGRETKERIDKADAALRELLGVEEFNALRERERSGEERNRVKHLRDELASGSAPLTKEQETLLLSAMSVERQAFPFRIDYSDPAKYDFEHIRDFFSANNLQAFYEDRKQLDSRILERASLFLDSTQVERLKDLQTEHLEKGRLTVKMTTELFNKRATK